MSNFQALPKKDWVTDYGFRKAMNGLGRRPDLGDYYQAEKSHKSLLDLIKYQDESARNATIEYFDLPDDTHAFLMWVYAWAAYREELPEGVKDQDEIFPYERLYAIYRDEARRHYVRQRNVSVYPDRLVDDTDDRVLMQWDTE